MTHQAQQVPQGMKRCTKCEAVKSTSDFHRNRKATDGLYGYCKSCSSAKSQQWRSENPERSNAYMREYRRKNRDRLTAQQAAWLAENPERAAAYRERQAEYVRKSRAKDPEAHDRKRRARTYKQKYGITLGEFEALLVRQRGVCWICQQGPGDGRLSALCVDHDHATGAVRGLLCQKCNRTLGLYGDDAEWFARAARYLRRPRKAGRRGTR